MSGVVALELLDQVLALRPHVDGDLLSETMVQLITLRDRLIAQRDARLGHVNAVISVVLAGQYPIGGMPWEELHRARDWLADIVAEG